MTSDYLSKLPAHVHQKVQARMTQKTLSNGDSIYLRNEKSDALYQVVSGEVRILNVTRDGREVLYISYHGGDCFGEIGLLDHEPRPHNAVASGPTVLSVLYKSDFDDLRQQYPEIDEQMILVLCQRLRLLFGFFEGSTLLPLPNRLAQRIFDLSTAPGKASDADSVHEIHLSQHDLANMMGASRQATGKVLKHWEEQGFIKLQYGKTAILDLKAIRAIADER